MRSWLVVTTGVGLALLAAACVPIPGHTEVLGTNWFQPEQGHCYCASLQRYGLPGLSDQNGESRLVVTEDGVPLAGPHSLHAAIRSHGSGRYSHWGDFLYVSASDNSDPRSNGRLYAIRVPVSASWLAARILTGRLGAARLAHWLSVDLGLAALLLGLARISLLGIQTAGRWGVVRVLPLTLVAAVLAATAFLFDRNALDVTQPRARLAYAMLACGLAGVFLGYAAWLIHCERRTEAPLPRPLRFVSRHISVLVCMLLVLFAVEAAARAVPVVDTMCINPAFRFFWPDYFLPRNSLGCNDREPGPKRGPRLLVIGDSYTEGVGMPRSGRYTSLLEARFRAEYPLVDVCNAAACGMTIWQKADTLERIGDTLRPDALLIALSDFDLWFDGPASADVKEDGTALPAGPSLFDWEKICLQRLHSYAFYRAKVGFCGVHIRAVPDETLLQVPGWRRLLSELDRIGLWCDARGTRKYLIIFPSFCAGGETLRWKLEQVLRAAQERGFTVHNGLDDVDGLPERFRISAYECHPNAAAHARIAEGLHRWMQVLSESYHAPSSAARGAFGGSEEAETPRR